MLHFSSFIEVLLYLGISIMIYSSFGYTFLKRIAKVKLPNYGILFSLPLYLAAGMIVFTFILYPIGMIIFNLLVVDIVTLIVVALTVAELATTVKRWGIIGDKNAPGKSLENGTKRRENIVAGLVFLVSVLFVAAILAVFEWPPVGDVINHGFYTSLIIYDQRIPTTFFPFRPDTDLHYPLGFHINAAYLSLLLDIYPGESVFLFGGVLMIGLSSLIYTLTYALTRSKWLSTLPYILSYLAYQMVPNGGFLEEWMFGYLYNGPYPNIFGFLIVLFSVTLLAFFATSKDWHIAIRLFPILMSVLLLTYPSFIFLPAVLLALFAFQVGIRNVIRDCLRTKSELFAVLFLTASFVFFSVYVYFQVVIGQVQIGYSPSIVYGASQDYLMGSVFGYSIIMAAILSVLMLVLGHVRASKLSLSPSELGEAAQLRALFLAYALTTILLISGLTSLGNTVLQYLLLSRLTILIMILSLITNVYALSKIVSITSEKVRSSALDNRLTVAKANKILLLMIIAYFFLAPAVLLFSISQIYGLVLYGFPDQTLLLLMTISAAANVCVLVMVFHVIIEKLSGPGLKKGLPLTKKNLLAGLTVFLIFNASGFVIYSLASQGSLSLANYYAWFPRSPSFQDDFKALEWLDGHAKNSELILNDWSWSSLYLQSLSIKNVSMLYIFRGFNITEELQEIWLHPNDSAMVHSLLTKYNVSYILVTSEWGFYDYLIDSIYKAKPYAPLDYTDIFSGYSFLELVFISGGAAIFKTV